MSHIFSFPPIAKASARILILGSIPGTRSLDLQQYYAHPRNQFWPIMAKVLGFDAQASYAERCHHIAESGIALWDVLQSCVRAGSLDSNIQPSSIIPNDFSAFFAAYPTIEYLFFNGGAAESYFRRHVLNAGGFKLPIPSLRLPSTSPANAGIRPTDKAAIWCDALNHCFSDR